jgi:hypothetical protein
MEGKRKMPWENSHGIVRLFRSEGEKIFSGQRQLDGA